VWYKFIRFVVIIYWEAWCGDCLVCVGWRLDVFCHAQYLCTFVLMGVTVGVFIYGVGICKFVVICCIFGVRLIVWIGVVL
jgi:hypothetical protein